MVSSTLLQVYAVITTCHYIVMSIYYLLVDSYYVVMDPLLLVTTIVMGLLLLTTQIRNR